MAAMRKTHLFQCEEIATHLTEAKAANPDGDWYQGILDMGFNDINDKKVCKWANLTYTSRTGLKAPLNFKVGSVQVGGNKHEFHSGRIQPNTDAAVAEMNASVIDQKFQIEKRQGAASIKTNKYTCQVKTLPDGITPAGDLPSDDKLSPLYTVASLVGEAFALECAKRKARGQAIIDAIAVGTTDARGIMKYTIKAGATAAAVAKSNPAKGAFMTEEQVALLRKLFPKDEASVALLTAGATVNYLKVCDVVSEVFAETSVHSGRPRPNPFVTIKLKNNEQGVLVPKVYDMSTLSYVGGKPSYEVLKVNNEPVNADNIHLAIPSRSEYDGIVKFDSICFSKTGISLTREVTMLFVQRPAAVIQNDFESMYEDLDNLPATVAGDAAAASPPATGAVGAAAAARTATADEIDEAYNDLLEDDA